MASKRVRAVRTWLKIEKRLMTWVDDMQTMVSCIIALAVGLLICGCSSVERSSSETRSPPSSTSRPPVYLGDGGFPMLVVAAVYIPCALVMKIAELLGEDVPPKDIAADIDRYRRIAEDGDADLQFCMGCIYSDGMVVPKDNVEAARWFRKAAEQGLAQAQSKLGEMCAKGDGVPQDRVEAYKWFYLSGVQRVGEESKEYEKLAVSMTPVQVTAGRCRAEAFVHEKCIGIEVHVVRHTKEINLDRVKVAKDSIRMVVSASSRDNASPKDWQAVLCSNSFIHLRFFRPCKLKMMAADNQKRERQTVEEILVSLTKDGGPRIFAKNGNQIVSFSKYHPSAAKRLLSEPALCEVQFEKFPNISDDEDKESNHSTPDR